MTDPELLSWLERIQTIATFLVAIGVAAEFAVGFISGPINRRIEAARQSEIAHLNEQAATARKAAADATEGTAKALADAAAANERAGKIELDAASQRERAAKAERDLLELRRRVQDRHLAPEQRKELIERLRSTPGEIRVTCVGGAPEPCVFALELVDAIKASGWTVTEFQQGVIFVGVNPSGLVIQVHSADKTPRHATVLQEALGKVGIEAPGVIVDGLPEAAVVLIVGSKP